MPLATFLAARCLLAVNLAIPPSAVPAAPAPAAPAAEGPPAPAAAGADDEVTRARREALIDLGVKALAAGRLDTAELAFEEAAALPGDPAREAYARGEAIPPPASAGSQPQPPRQPRAAPPAPPATSATSASARPSNSASARATFLSTTTLLGLAAYGWSLPLTLGVDVDDSGRAFLGLYMVTAGASFVAPYFLTRGRGVTPAEANLAWYGGTRGLWHGALVAAILGGDVGPDSELRPWTAGLLLGSVGEMAAGFALAERAGISPGHARTIGVGGDFGLGIGFATGALLGLHHNERTADQQARGMASMGFLGAAAGLGGGYLLGRQRQNTWGDGEVLRAAGLLGVWLGVTANLVFDWNPETWDDEKKFFTSLIAGGALGLVVGDRLVLDTDFSVTESVLLDLAMVAGGLGAAGLTYLLSGDQDVGPEPFAVAAAVGGIAGFTGVYLAFRGDRSGRDPDDAKHAAAPRDVALLPVFGRAGERGISLAGRF
jgi:hypothetical protein